MEETGVQMGERITLPPVADLTEAGSLKESLLQALTSGTSVGVDASTVQRISSPYLQVLVAGAQSFAKAGGASMKIVDPSDTFRETVSVLGLLDVLELGK